MGNEHSKDLFGGKDESQLRRVQSLDFHSKHIRNVKGIRLSLFTSLVTLNLSLNELENVRYLLILKCFILKKYSGIEELQATLEELDLSSNPLKSTEPIFQLLKLKVLNLERTTITELSTNIGCLSLLISLNCSYNQIKELPKQIEACKQLTKLILNKNELRTLPKEIGNLPALELLNLADNFLGELPPEIGQLYNLKKLYIDHNELLELPSQVSKLTRLRELNISCNQLATLPHSIGYLSNLQLLDLENNEFNSPEYKTEDLPSFLSWLVNQQTPVKKLRTRRTRTRLSVDERTDATLKSFHTNKKSTSAASFRFVSNKNSLYIVKGKNRIYIRQVHLYITHHMLNSCRKK
jgi:Leucine-rich repeat (LRR) protein